MSEKQPSKDKDYYLIGYPEPTIPDSKLPTLGAVLKNFFYVKKHSPDIRTAILAVVDNVISIWKTARIPTALPRNCVRRLKKLYEEWQTLDKHKTRKGDKHDRRGQFKRKLLQVWDIGPVDIIAQIKARDFLSEEERENDVRFYLDQKHERLRYISGKDKVLAEAPASGSEASAEVLP